MGFDLGGLISGGLKSIVSTVAPKFVDAVKSVSSEAVGALKNVVSSGFDSIVKGAGDSIGKLASGFPGIAGLAGKLLGQGAEAVKGLIEQGAGSLEKWLSDKIGQLTPRTLENGQSVTPPTAATRDFTAEFGKIKDIIGKFFPQPQNQESYDAQFKSAVETLNKNFSLLDTAAGIGGKDNVVGQLDLKAAMNNPKLPKELKDAIGFLMQNPAAMHQLDVAAGKGNVDGFISKADMEAAVKSLAPTDTKEPASTLTPEQTAMLDKIKDPALKDVLKSVFEMLNKGQAAATTPATTPAATTPAASNDILAKIMDLLKQLIPGASTGGTSGASGTSGTSGTGAAGTPSNDLMTQLMNMLKQAGLVPNTTAGGTGTSTGAATGTAGGTSTASTPATSSTTPASTTAAGGSMLDIVNRGLAGANGQLTQQENDMLSKIQDPNQKAMMKAQMEMQHAQEMLSFISNIMKKMNEMAMAVIGNMR